MTLEEQINNWKTIVLELDADDAPSKKEYVARMAVTHTAMLNNDTNYTEILQEAKKHTLLFERIAAALEKFIVILEKGI